MTNNTNRPQKIAPENGLKNPLERTRLPTLPPGLRSRTAQGMTRAAAEGTFELQVCDTCVAVQYPPREICGACLSTALHWRSVPDGGVLLARTTLRHSNDLYFRERLPWHIGTVQMDAGPVVIAHVAETCAQDGRVRLMMKLDRSGQAVLHALPEDITEKSSMEEGLPLREGQCDPDGRRILITNGKSALGQILAQALLKAGARTVFIGDPTPWNKVAAFDALCAADKRIEPVALDVTDTDSVNRLAAMLGGKIDILLNTPDYLRHGGILESRDVLQARESLDIHVLGLIRLAQAFGPGMRFRGADVPVSAAAWVNIFSIHALAALPARADWSAAQAAALSLSHSLRAEMRSGGIRVMNVFSGPLEETWEQLTPPPKVGLPVLANAIIKGLQTGLEEVYVGEVAEEIRLRLRENHKALERELGQR